MTRIRVVVSGGGMAGALLTLALLQYEHLDVHLFESAPNFRKSGMGLSLARNATQALSLIGTAAAKCFERAGAVPQHGVRFMLATGPDAEKQIDAARPRSKSGSPTSVVSRAAFLEELLNGIPPERLHVSKKLVGAEQPTDGDGLTLQFEDGTNHVCDVLVGADGIHSIVRKMILGSDDPAAVPQYAGWRCNITLQPYEKMRAVLGRDFVDRDSPFEYGWIGDGTWMMHEVLSGGQVVQFVIAACSDSGEEKHDIVEVKKTFRDWPPRLRDALAEILGDQDKVSMFGLWHHSAARTYTKGKMCVMGDAAHTSTPWQGSGGGMSVEDVLILSTLLGRINSPDEISTALAVYDEARRQRTQRVVETSWEMGKICTGRHDQFPLNLSSFDGQMSSRWGYIMEFDNAGAVEEAKQRLDSELHKGDAA